jgi:outer membrane protein assembly factor BamB
MLRRSKLLIVAAATVLLLAATGVIAWRVLRPTEIVTPATSAYPAPAIPGPGALGTLVSAPLILNESIRIYAKKREVWSDGPASYHYERSAYWAYRRWPAQITGVLAFQGDSPLVVTSWSDGMLVAIVAETGQVAWRAQGSVLADEYTGRRTGADTVYHPPGLLSSGARVITLNDLSISALSADTGQALWTFAPPFAQGECRGIAFTTSTRVYVHDKCADTLERLDLTTGQRLAAIPAVDEVEPLSCVVGFSECSAMRVTENDKVTGWVVDGADPEELPPLAAPGSLYTGQSVVIPSAETLSTVDSSGTVLWTWKPAEPGPFRLLSADTTRIVVLEVDGTLVSLDPRNGRFKSYASAIMPHERDKPVDWEIRTIYTSGSYLVLERINPGVPESASDDAFYYTHRPVLLASAGP